MSKSGEVEKLLDASPVLDGQVGVALEAVKKGLEQGALLEEPNITLLIGISISKGSTQREFEVLKRLGFLA